MPQCHRSHPRYRRRTDRLSLSMALDSTIQSPPASGTPAARRRSAAKPRESKGPWTFGPLGPDRGRKTPMSRGQRRDWQYVGSSTESVLACSGEWLVGVGAHSGAEVRQPLLDHEVRRAIRPRSRSYPLLSVPCLKAKTSLPRIWTQKVCPKSARLLRAALYLSAMAGAAKYSFEVIANGTMVSVRRRKSYVAKLTSAQPTLKKSSTAMIPSAVNVRSARRKSFSTC